jgi:SH3-like domain-containing protein
MNRTREPEAYVVGRFANGSCGWIEARRAAGQPFVATRPATKEEVVLIDAVKHSRDNDESCARLRALLWKPWA